MNIIYKLTNRNKTSGKRFYIGSKMECKFLEVDGIPTIYNVKTGLPYYGSSCNFEFKEDFKNRHVFEAEVLEVVVKREDLRERENYYLQLYDAVASEEYYNMSHAFIRSHALTAVRNKYGETTSDFASAQSQASKRDGNAIALGYKNFGELYFKIYERLQAGENVCDVSKECGRHRQWASTVLKSYDMEKAKLDLQKYTSEQLREYIINGASLKFAAEDLGIELPAARILLGDFGKAHEKSFSVALERGKSKKELEKEITFRILDGEGFIDIGNSMTLCRESILRYFLRCVQANKKDIKKILDEKHK